MFLRIFNAFVLFNVGDSPFIALDFLGSSQGAQLEVYTLHSLLHAIQQRLTLVVMLFCGG